MTTGRFTGARVFITGPTARISSYLPLGRLGRPEDVVAVAMFLAGPEVTP